MFTDLQQEELTDLVNDTILPAISEDLGIYDNEVRNEAIDFLICKLQAAKS